LFTGPLAPLKPAENTKETQLLCILVFKVPITTVITI
jgi:hypothetical protein